MTRTSATARATPTASAAIVVAMVRRYAFALAGVLVLSGSSLASAAPLRGHEFTRIADESMLAEPVLDLVMSETGVVAWIAATRVYRYDGTSSAQVGAAVSGATTLRMADDGTIAFLSPAMGGLYVARPDEAEPRLLYDLSTIPPGCDALNPPGIGAWDIAHDGDVVQFTTCSNVYTGNIDSLEISSRLLVGDPIEGFSVPDPRYDGASDIFAVGSEEFYAQFSVACDGFGMDCFEQDVGWVTYPDAGSIDLLWSLDEPLAFTELTPSAGIFDTHSAGLYLIGGDLGDGAKIHAVEGSTVSSTVEVGQVIDGAFVDGLTVAPVVGDGFGIVAAETADCFVVGGVFDGIQGAVRSCSDTQDIIVQVGDLVFGEEGYTIATLDDISVPKDSPRELGLTAYAVTLDTDDAALAPALLAHYEDVVNLPEIVALQGDIVDVEGMPTTLSGPFRIGSPRTWRYDAEFVGDRFVFMSGYEALLDTNLWIVDLYGDTDTSEGGDTDEPGTDLETGNGGSDSDSSGASEGGADGCSCRAEPAPRGVAWSGLGLLGLMLLSRRRR